MECRCVAYIVSPCREVKSLYCCHPPFLNREVSIASLLQDFNDVICVEHFPFNEILLFHFMNSYSSFSAALAVLPTSFKQFLAFESIRLSQFCPPSSVIVDLVFCHKELLEIIRLYDLSYLRCTTCSAPKKCALVQAWCYSIDLPLSYLVTQNAPSQLLAAFAASTSIEIYGSDTIPFFEMPKYYSKPIYATYLSSLSLPGSLLHTKAMERNRNPRLCSSLAQIVIHW